MFEDDPGLALDSGHDPESILKKRLLKRSVSSVCVSKKEEQILTKMRFLFKDICKKCLKSQ